jgi:hypothetical protein
MADSHKEVRPLAGASGSVIDAVLELNRREVALLSEMDHQRLSHLVAEAFRATVIGEGEAFLIAFDQSAWYDSPNFRWFQARYTRFIYVDRIAVSPGARGRGHAGRLYNDLFAAAQLAGHEVVVCEVNVDPPNPASDAFHGTWGFEEVGRATLESGKVVRYLARMVSESQAA